jgi:hypothetical protein
MRKFEEKETANFFLLLSITHPKNNIRIKEIVSFSIYQTVYFFSNEKEKGKKTSIRNFYKL